ncbi:hypothetical protein ONZ45_g4125 [Pleurotus djamor]|nr:hypothetical protein ONZ45_g4125 [Pleurotus djamor]
MVVRREDNSVVDVDEVDSSFFLVTVDLWSGDAKQEMNLVLHPSSSDRYVPTQPKPRRRGTSTSAPQNSGHQTPSRSTPAPQQFPSRSRDSQGGGLTPIVPPQTPAFSPTSYFPPNPDAMDFQSPHTYGPSSEQAPTWGYPQSASVDRNTTFPPPVLPSIHSFGRSSNGITHPFTYLTNTPLIEHPDSSLQGNTNNAYASQPTTENNIAWNHQQSSETSPQQFPPSSTSGTSTTQPEHSIYASASYAQHTSHGEFYATSINPSSAIPPLPRHTYTRTLVGPLSANACRLLDEHRKPGIFFLFQDLSVRTEGTFRLRMRLMNVGAPPAPEQGAMRVHNDFSPVLAQTFSEPFVVYSAKRFPGVPDTTALSIAFGNQGQKLPLRNRHGSSKRRRRGDSDSEDEDSDGA